MRFFRKIAEILGLSRDEDVHGEGEDEGEEAEQHIPQSRPRSGYHHQTGVPRKGFSVPVRVAVDRPGPVLLPCNSGDGGVQGLKWYSRQLKMDEDGDVADEFLDETPPETVSFNPSEQHQHQHHMSLPRFEAKHSGRHVKVKRQVITPDGKLQHLIEYQGRRRLV